MSLEKEDQFSYEALNRHFNRSRDFLENDAYMVAVLPTNPTFIGFVRRISPAGKSTEEGKIFKKYGLKFHISLPEYDQQMYCNGWAIIRDTLMRNNVVSFKLVRDVTRMSETPGQEGKDVTVYVDAEPNRTLREWSDLLQEITQRLVGGDVSPGYRSHGTSEKREEPINGSNYITYRYEGIRQNGVWPTEDHCQNIIVRVNNQRDIPVKDTTPSAAAAAAAPRPTT